jgi:hypothetical protein
MSLTLSFSSLAPAVRETGAVVPPSVQVALFLVGDLHHDLALRHAIAQIHGPCCTGPSISALMIASSNETAFPPNPPLSRTSGSPPVRLDFHGLVSCQTLPLAAGSREGR